MGVFFLFLLATSAGCLSTLYSIRESDLGRGYFQMNALIILGLLGLAVTMFWLHPFAPFEGAVTPGAISLHAAFVGAFLYYAFVWRRRWSGGRWAVTLSLAGSVGALLLAGVALIREVAPLPHRTLLLVATLIASALLLGWSLITMLLGHWYLVAPRLAFRHLTLFCWVLLALVLVRGLTVGSSLIFASTVNDLLDPHPLRILTGFAGQGMFFWFRILWGLAIPLLLAVMSLNCAIRKSNQSATGILYVLVVGTFIGEITALYVTLSVGVPI
ncbi:MAG: hypothetical protein OES47_14375 [Acidobacteriota bacterium]|nr:hypothetical protein [Acidobacteriota bacterium]